MTGRVLIVEDARSVAASYADALSRDGWSADTVDRLAGAAQKIKSGRYNAVLLDLLLPDGDGLTLLSALQKTEGAPPVIAVTSDGSISRAVEATRKGAFDFLVKPVSSERLTSAVSAAARGAASPTAGDGDFGIIGASPAIRALKAQIRRVARSDATVFVTGESGSGKELCAFAVHSASSRASGPFIALNCAAIPVDLMESTLFGHLKGSFTGAVSDQSGAARAADGGTLFLDEICEMAPELQTKLLRFLETRTVTPVGATAPRPVDVRIICATNRDPRREVEAGRFREDLYYRLHVLPLQNPPLRERGDDVLEIADHLLTRFAGQEGKAVSGFSAPARAAIRRAPWRGNVRELINVIRQAVVLGDGPEIGPELLNLETVEGAPLVASPAAPAPEPAPTAAPDPEEAAARLATLPLAEVERMVIDAAIRIHGTAPKAAKSLQVSPSTIYRKMESWRRASADG